MYTHSDAHPTRGRAGRAPIKATEAPIRQIAHFTLIKNYILRRERYGLYGRMLNASTPPPRGIENGRTARVHGSLDGTESADTQTKRIRALGVVVCKLSALLWCQRKPGGSRRSHRIRHDTLASIVNQGTDPAPRSCRHAACTTQAHHSRPCPERSIDCSRQAGRRYRALAVEQA